MVLGGHGSWAWWTLASPKEHSIKVSTCSQTPFWDGLGPGPGADKGQSESEPQDEQEVGAV